MIYSATLWFFLLGAILPIPIFLWVRKHPKHWLQYIHVPIIMGGNSLLIASVDHRPRNDPSSHAHELHLMGHCQVFTPAAVYLTASFIFNFMVKRRWPGWWTKYNYVLVHPSTRFSNGLVCWIGYWTCNRDTLYLFCAIIHANLANLRFLHTMT